MKAYRASMTWGRQQAMAPPRSPSSLGGWPRPKDREPGIRCKFHRALKGKAACTLQETPAVSSERHEGRVARHRGDDRGQERIALDFRLPVEHRRCEEGAPQGALENGADAGSAAGD